MLDVTDALTLLNAKLRLARGSYVLRTGFLGSVEVIHAEIKYTLAGSE